MKPRKRILALLVGLGSTAVVALIAVSVLQAIYPGSLKWTAPVMCPDEQPDAFVVRTVTQDSEGTAISFSLFCMGERGQFTEAGSWRPYGLLFLYTWAAVVVIVLLALAKAAHSHRRSRESVNIPAQ